MSFLNPFMLLALAGIALPIAIHFISRTKPQTYLFPSLRFLKHEKLETVSKRQLSNPWLLLLRILIYLTLILFFAKPYFPEKVSENQQQTLSVIFLDTSASMSKFQAKLNSAMEDVLDQHDLFLLCTDLDYSDERLSSAQLTERLKQVKMGLHTANPEKIIQRLSAELQLTQQPIELHIFSDFQQSNWKWDQKIPFPGKVVFHPLEIDSKNNTSITKISSSLSPDTSELQVKALVTNHSELNQKFEATLSCKNQLQRQSITLKPYEKKQVLFTLQKPVGASSAQLNIINNDTYAFDNQYILWCGDSPQLSLGHVQSDPKSKTMNPYLKMALELNDSLGRSVPSQRVKDLTKLTKTRALFVADQLASLNPDQLKLIESFVRAGGLLIVAPQEQLRANLLTLNRFNDIQINQTPQAIEKGPFYFSIKDKSLPELSPFSNSPDADLTLTPSFRYHRIKSNGQAFLWINETFPALIRFPLGKGNLIFSSIPFHPDWSDFIFSKSFLPLMRHLVFTYSPNAQNILKTSPGELASTLKENALIPQAVKVDQNIYEINVSPLESSTQILDPLVLKSQFTQTEKTSSQATHESKQANHTVWLILFFLLLLLESIFIQFSPRAEKAKA